jgi:hypothetical protein
VWSPGCDPLCCLAECQSTRLRIPCQPTDLTRPNHAISAITITHCHSPVPRYHTCQVRCSPNSYHYHPPLEKATGVARAQISSYSACMPLTSCTATKYVGFRVAAWRPMDVPTDLAGVIPEDHAVVDLFTDSRFEADTGPLTKLRHHRLQYRRERLVRKRMPTPAGATARHVARDLPVGAAFCIPKSPGMVQTLGLWYSPIEDFSDQWPPVVPGWTENCEPPPVLNQRLQVQ